MRMDDIVNDTISRQVAIKAADSIIERDTSGNNDVVKAMTAWKEYIEALPPAQPGCEDAVSRFEVLRLIDYSSHDLNDAVDNRYMQNEIKQLPSVTPKQPGWIPVTKRLPEEEGLYLVAGDFPPGAEVHTRYFNVMYDRSVWSGTMTDKVKWWMPIPNPPEGGQK